MRKAFVIGFMLSFVTSMSAFADEANLLERIEALEQRVASLESMVIQGQPSSDPATPTAPVVLDVGTWIVGEDIPEGKYNLMAPSSSGSMCYVYSSLDDKLHGGIVKDVYSVTTEEYKDSFASLMEGQAALDVLLDSMQTEIFNVYITESQCLEISGGSLEFTPVQ